MLRTGSLIAGSRPEWIGSIGLIGEHPAGYGFGAEPMYEDVWIARQGLYTVGIGSDNGYVDNYMFGGFFRLHSGAADLWAQTGLVGLACALGLVLVVFGGISARLRNRTLTALVSFLSLNTLWDIGFSPLQSASLGIAVTLGFLLLEHPPGADQKPEGVGRSLH